MNCLWRKLPHQINQVNTKQYKKTIFTLNQTKNCLNYILVIDHSAFISNQITSIRKRAAIKFKLFAICSYIVMSRCSKESNNQFARIMRKGKIFIIEWSIFEHFYSLKKSSLFIFNAGRSLRVSIQELQASTAKLSLENPWKNQQQITEVCNETIKNGQQIRDQTSMTHDEMEKWFSAQTQIKKNQ